ncbi:hypothetical protein MKEN_00381500 [Mycena kentingensis (nom. inval.)]|nr:hypothetical protein MKEN_00381500 [Mycena kentingensis (nom. inval.)]
MSSDPDQTPYYHLHLINASSGCSLSPSAFIKHSSLDLPQGALITVGDMISSAINQHERNCIPKCSTFSMESLSEAIILSPARNPQAETTLQVGAKRSHPEQQPVGSSATLLTQIWSHPYPCAQLSSAESIHAVVVLRQKTRQDLLHAPPEKKIKLNAKLAELIPGTRMRYVSGQMPRHCNVYMRLGRASAYPDLYSAASDLRAASSANERFVAQLNDAVAVTLVPYLFRAMSKLSMPGVSDTQWLKENGHLSISSRPESFYSLPVNFARCEDDAAKTAERLMRDIEGFWNEYKALLGKDGLPDVAPGCREPDVWLRAILNVMKETKNTMFFNAIFGIDLLEPFARNQPERIEAAVTEFRKLADVIQDERFSDCLLAVSAAPCPGLNLLVLANFGSRPPPNLVDHYSFMRHLGLTDGEMQTFLRYFYDNNEEYDDGVATPTGANPRDEMSALDQVVDFLRNQDGGLVGPDYIDSSRMSTFRGWNERMYSFEAVIDAAAHLYDSRGDDVLTHVGTPFPSLYEQTLRCSVLDVVIKRSQVGDRKDLRLLQERYAVKFGFPTTNVLRVPRATMLYRDFTRLTSFIHSTGSQMPEIPLYFLPRLLKAAGMVAVQKIVQGRETHVEIKPVNQKAYFEMFEHLTFEFRQFDQNIHDIENDAVEVDEGTEHPTTTWLENMINEHFGGIDMTNLASLSQYRSETSVVQAVVEKLNQLIPSLGPKMSAALAEISIYDVHDLVRRIDALIWPDGREYTADLRAAMIAYLLEFKFGSAYSAFVGTFGYAFAKALEKHPYQLCPHFDRYRHHLRTIASIVKKFGRDLWNAVRDSATGGIDKEKLKRELARPEAQVINNWDGKTGALKYGDVMPTDGDQLWVFYDAMKDAKKEGHEESGMQRRCRVPLRRMFLQMFNQLCGTYTFCLTAGRNPEKKLAYRDNSEGEGSGHRLRRIGVVFYCGVAFAIDCGSVVNPRRMYVRVPDF